MTPKLGQKSKIRPDELEVLCHNLRIRILTLDRVILHTVMHHSSTSTYTPNFIEIMKLKKRFVAGRADGHLRPTLLGRLGGVDLKMRTILQGWKLRHKLLWKAKQTF